MTDALHAQGEERHEQCRYGVFAEQAYRVDLRTGKETPFAMPLCAWQPSEKAPPLLARVWSGAIEFERDCAVCRCFAPVIVNQSKET